MDSNFEKIAPDTETREGLYSATRSDPGNWTSGIVGIGRLVGSMRGISAPTMAHWLGSVDLVTPQIMQRIDHATFMAIARAYYWRALNADALGVGIDRMLFDFGFNAGVSRAAKQFQQIVGVPEKQIDGDIGAATLRALNLVRPEGVAGFVARGWAVQLQQDLGVSPDGALGPITLSAINRQSMWRRLMIYALASRQELAYRSFSGFLENGDGWMARLNWRVRASLSDLDALAQA